MAKPATERLQEEPGQGAGQAQAQAACQQHQVAPEDGLLPAIVVDEAASPGRPGEPQSRLPTRSSCCERPASKSSCSGSRAPI